MITNPHRESGDFAEQFRRFESRMPQKWLTLQHGGESIRVARTSFVLADAQAAMNGVPIFEPGSLSPGSLIEVTGDVMRSALPTIVMFTRALEDADLKETWVAADLRAIANAFASWDHMWVSAAD